MKKLMLFVVLVAWLLPACKSEEEDGEEGVCVEGEGTSSCNSLYNKNSKWRYYLELINTSLSSFSPCEEEEEGKEKEGEGIGCGCFTPTIGDDLEVWQRRGGIQWEEFSLAQRWGVRYQVRNHTLYRQAECPYPSRCAGVEHFLLQLTHTLPNMEMIINVADYPVSQNKLHPRPIFSFSKTASHLDIMYPAWSFWSGGPAIATEPKGLGRWDLKRRSLLKASQDWPWPKKRNSGYFRGSRTSSARDPLILLSREEPELVDAQYTKNQAWRSEKDTLGYPPATVVTMEHHCQYRYLFNFRGVAASFRLRHLFLCGSLVLHVGTEWVEFFYPALRPWVHYVPLPTDLSNVRDVLEFLAAHDNVAKEIADRGFEHVWKQLDMDAVTCYWRELLSRYWALCRWEVSQRQDDSFVKLQ